VRIYGEVAIATGIVSLVCDQDSKPKRTAFTDVVVRRAGKWLTVNAQELPLGPESKSAQTDSGAANTGTKETATERDGQHDFDFNFGTWKTHVSRLLHPLSGSIAWAEYDGISVVRRLWNGRASVFELQADGPASHIEGVGLRLYNPQSHQWSLNWVSSRDGTMQQPMVGEFKNGRGEFYDQESFNGRAIFSRNGFSDIIPDSSHFEQAFSDDGGKTFTAKE
jgi:hypothetical protein